MSVGYPGWFPRRRRRLVPPYRSIAVHRCGHADDAKRVALAAAKPLLQLAHEVTFVRRPQSSFLRRPRLQHGLVQAQTGNDLLELPVLLLQLPKPAHLRRSYPAVLLLADVERRRADAHLAAHLLHPSTQLRLLQRKSDLVLQ